MSVRLTGTGHRTVNHMTLIKCSVPVLLLFSAASLALAQDQPALTLQGVSGKTLVFTSADLAKLPRQTIQATDHGSPATFEGVLLSDVLAKVDLPLGDKFHSTAASYYMLVEARDGYRAVFAWAELDPGFMDKAIYVVTRRDGHALAEKDGPFQLVAPDEKRGGRWVRQVTALRIQQAH